MAPFFITKDTIEKQTPRNKDATFPTPLSNSIMSILPKPSMKRILNHKMKYEKEQLKRRKRSPPVVAALSALMPFIPQNTSTGSSSSMITSLTRTSSDNRHFSSSTLSNQHSNKVFHHQDKDLPPLILTNIERSLQEAPHTIPLISHLDQALYVNKEKQTMLETTTHSLNERRTKIVSSTIVPALNILQTTENTIKTIIPSNQTRSRSAYSSTKFFIEEQTPPVSSRLVSRFHNTENPGNRNLTLLQSKDFPVIQNKHELFVPLRNQTKHISRYFSKPTLNNSKVQDVVITPRKNAKTKILYDSLTPSTVGLVQSTIPDQISKPEHFLINKVTEDTTVHTDVFNKTLTVSMPETINNSTFDTKDLNIEVINDTQNNSNLSSLNFELTNDYAPTKSHVDLEMLEKQLSNQVQDRSSDLLLAISILQHHSVPESPVESQFELNENLTNVFIKKNKSIDLQTSSLVELDNSSVTYLRRRTFEETTPKIDISTQLEPDKKAYHFPSHFNVEVSPALFNNRNADEIPENSNDYDNQVDNLLQTKIKNQERNKNITDKESKPIDYENRYKWFVLVMDGDCGIIRSRMKAFVTFLKAALSSKLDTQFDDISVPSVFCDNTFMVNISLNIGKYPKASTKLQSLAEANTTLLEISGEIFYLEKILTQKPETRFTSKALIKKSDDVELVIYIAVGCMCVFILLSVVIVALIKICKQEDHIEIKHEYQDRAAFPIRQPNVIYSHRFSQALNPEKYRLKPFEDSHSLGEAGVAPSSSSSFGTILKYGSERSDGFSSSDHYERKSHVIPSSSKLELLEDVQEEDEEEEDDEDEIEIDEEFQLNDDDEEELEEAEFIANNLENVLRNTENSNQGSSKRSNPGSSFTRKIRNLALPSTSVPPTSQSNESDYQIGFDNPCYGR